MRNTTRWHGSGWTPGRSHVARVRLARSRAASVPRCASPACRRSDSRRRYRASRIVTRPSSHSSIGRLIAPVGPFRPHPPASVFRLPCPGPQRSRVAPSPKTELAKRPERNRLSAGSPRRPSSHHLTRSPTAGAGNEVLFPGSEFAISARSALQGSTLQTCDNIQIAATKVPLFICALS